MKQFDVIRDRAGDLYCVLQHDFLSGLSDVLLAPLRKTDAPAMKGVSIPVEIDGERYLLEPTRQVSVLRTQAARGRRIANLDDQRDAIMDAINKLYWGI